MISHQKSQTSVVVHSKQQLCTAPTYAQPASIIPKYVSFWSKKNSSNSGYFFSLYFWYPVEGRQKYFKNVIFKTLILSRGAVIINFETRNLQSLVMLWVWMIRIFLFRHYFRDILPRRCGNDWADMGGQGGHRVDRVDTKMIKNTILTNIFFL